MTRPKMVICPYCGDAQRAEEHCRTCQGSFDALSRQASHNEMGPWSVRDADRPFRPGCSYETLVRMVERGQIDRFTIMKGPTTRQFWTVAKRVPGVAHLIGYCHACDQRVDPDDHVCEHCNEPFGAYLDRDFLGLPDVRPLPGDAPGDSGAPIALTPRIAPTARGVSSFGADSDLLLETPPVAPAAIREPAVVTESGAAPAPLIDPALERSLLRRIRQLERANRIVTLALVLVILAGAITIAVALANRPGPAAGDDVPAAPETEPVPAVTDERPAAPEVEPMAASATVPETVAPEVAQAASPGAGGEVPSAAVVPPLADAFASGFKLAEEAGRVSLPREERIELYQRAIEALEEARRATSADLHPGDLEVRLDSLRREQERLRLQGFFGEG